MLNDNTSMVLCTITLLLFFIGGITGVLDHPLYIAIIIIAYLVVIINLVVVKKPETHDAFFEPKKKK